MIPVKPEPEPSDFDRLVRTPGNDFLATFTSSMPTSKQLEKKNYWKSIRHKLYESYKGVCAYSALHIPRYCYPNIDHFIPKSVKPELAYEWGNYRLSCPFVNMLKKNFQDVLDPFEIEKDWFFLDFPSLIVKANPQLSDEIKAQVHSTIKRLHLNDEDPFVKGRNAWLKPYCTGLYDFSYLKDVAPFIAYELKRQGLTENIKVIMVYSSEYDEDD